MSIGKFLPTFLKVPLLRVVKHMRLSPAAHAERRQDHQGLPLRDPGNELAIQSGLEWLATAQDHSASHDGGFARHYSLVSGWSTSYPETSGYIVPTLIEHSRRRGDPALLARAQKAVDWLVSIQFPEGGFQGSTIGSPIHAMVTFDTGQILQALAAGVLNFGEAYRPAMLRAADWLVTVQDADGCWRYPNPFVDTDADRAFETHVAWGLLEVARLSKDPSHERAAMRNIDWALSQQTENGWFANCCLAYPEAPLTHTLAYALRGVIEGFLFSREPRLLEASLKTATGILAALDADGFLPGRLNHHWLGSGPWACLTGSAQMGICWLLLYRETRDARFRDAAFRVNSYVRRTLHTAGSSNVLGGVKGAFPADGGYNEYQFLNWACKFMIDACTLEADLRAQEA